MPILGPTCQASAKKDCLRQSSYKRHLLDIHAEDLPLWRLRSWRKSIPQNISSRRNTFTLIPETLSLIFSYAVDLIGHIEEKPIFALVIRNVLCLSHY